jgi:hypothetical protein
MGLNDFSLCLKQLRDYAGTTSLDPFLRGFQESSFKAKVQAFVCQRAQKFAVMNDDGSHPLVWTQYHAEYCDIFEAQLERILQAVGMNKGDLRQFCCWLEEHYMMLDEQDEIMHSGGVRVGEFKPFIASLTASEDYLTFLQIMFDELERQYDGGATAGPNEAEDDDVAEVPLPLGGCDAVKEPAPVTQELQVAVPEGMGPGQLLAVDYLGLRYELAIPDGCYSGSAFRALVTLPGA